jgi:hypothetical protein
LCKKTNGKDTMTNFCLFDDLFAVYAELSLPVLNNSLRPKVADGCHIDFPEVLLGGRLNSLSRYCHVIPARDGRGGAEVTDRSGRREK